MGIYFFRSFSKTVTDSFVISDTLTIIRAKFADLVESFVVGDVLTRIIQRTAIETATITDTLTTLRMKFSTLTESFSLTDAVTRTMQRLFTETPVITDVLSKQPGKVVSETLVLNPPGGSASDGPNLPGTAVDDNGVGTVAWTNPTNIEVGISPATASISAGNGVKDFIVSIIKTAGTVGLTNKASAAGWVKASQASFTYGGSSDLWGETWTAADINSSAFGLALSAYSPGDNTSHYLKGTNFGFAISTGATINGIAAEINHNNTGSLGGGLASVYYFKLTVTYTPTASATELSKATTRPLPETTTITDTINKSTVRTALETFSLTDIFTSLKVRVATLIESITITDTITRTINAVRAESISLLDDLLKTLGRIILLESISLSDAFGRIWTVVRTYTESFSITDSIKILLNGTTTIWTRILESATGLFTNNNKSNSPTYINTNKASDSWTNNNKSSGPSYTDTNKSSTPTWTDITKD